MKKRIIVLFLLFSSIGFSQTKGMFSYDPLVNLENFDKSKVYWGYFLGFSTFDFKTDYKVPGQDINVKGNSGFNVGLVGVLRLHEYLELRFEPGLYYTQRNLTYPEIEDPFDALREVKSTYIMFPLLVKFSSKRVGNVRPYLVGGASATLNLSSNETASDDNYNNRFRMQTWTYDYQVGFGIDFYFE